MDRITLYVCYVCETVSHTDGVCINCGEKLAKREYMPVEDTAALREAAEAARENEYVYMPNHTGDADYYCPECRTLKGYGHTKNCKIAAALAKLEGAR
jgi:hypothetical protein